MTIEDARRGGCLDGFVTRVTKGRYGIETVIVYPDAAKLPRDADKRPIATFETYFGEGIPALPIIQRRLVKTPKVI